MNDLMQLALEATQKNVQSKARKESINDALLRILHESSETKTKVQLIAQITLDRLKDEFGESALKKMRPEEFGKHVGRVNKTVKNGIDTSVSRSNNNSSFHYNPKYKQYKLEYDGVNLSIVDRKKK